MAGTVPIMVEPEVPERADRDALLKLLAAFEAEKAGSLGFKPVAILIKDEAEATIGGLYGWVMFRWLIIESVYVPERFRGAGTGTTLMVRAEAIARQRDCIGMWLDTYSFQARGLLREARLHGLRPGRRPSAGRTALLPAETVCGLVRLASIRLSAAAA